jgi:hypothetical protein
MCYLYVYICLWMYWITNIMISMFMYLAMLYPINDLIWLYATTAYHAIYWNVSDIPVICHICIPYYILTFFRLSCFSTVGIYPFKYSNLSDNHVICTGTEINGRPLAMATETSAGRLIILYFLVSSLTFEASCLQYDHVKYNKHFTGSGSFYFLSTVICVIIPVNQYGK